MNEVHFTDEDWARIERDTLAWWAGELNRPLVYLSATEPQTETPSGSTERRFGYLSNHPMEMSAEEIVELQAPTIESTRYYADAFPWWLINCGPGIVAGFVGAEVHSVTDPLETVWFTPTCQGGIDQLTLRYDASNIWWQRVQALTKAAAARWQGMVAIGHTDLGGNLDILASLRTTQELSLDLVDHPEEVERLSRETTSLWIEYYDKLEELISPPCYGTTCWTPIWSPGKTYMLQCDFSYMISPKMFERFVVPDLIACCNHLDHGFYHLDGKGEIPHLDLLLSIERLRGIQWIPGDGQPGPHKWLPLLKRIRDGGKLCQIYTSPEGARQIVSNLGGKGFLLVIQSNPDEFLDPENAKAFLRTLKEEDISQC